MQRAKRGESHYHNASDLRSARPRYWGTPFDKSKQIYVNAGRSYVTDNIKALRISLYLTNSILSRVTY